jgi:iron complex outermembrane receptor protein
MLYANWSTGYRPVGMAIQPTIKPERIDAYTLGIKNRFFGNKLQLNITSYLYDYTDYVAEFGRVADPDNFNRNDEGATTNADLKYAGIEVQTSTILSSNDKLNFSVSYLNSLFTRLLFDFDNPNFPDQDFTGKPETFTPKWTFDMNYSHNFNLMNGGVLTARIDSRYQSDYLVSFVDLYQEMIGEGFFGTPTYNFLSRAPFVTQDAHHISNVSMIYANPDGKWTLTGYIKNIENYAEKKSMMMNSIMIGSPRTYGAVLSVHY